MRFCHSIAHSRFSEGEHKKKYLRGELSALGAADTLRPKFHKKVNSSNKVAFCPAVILFSDSAFTKSDELMGVGLHVG